MFSRLLAGAVFLIPLMLAFDAARADCLWAVGMAERDLAGIERAAPLAADRSLSLGPGGPAWISGSHEDFADRAKLAFGMNATANDEIEVNAAVIEARITWARDRLALARANAGRGDQEGCAAALDQALDAIDGARAAFR